MVEMSMGSLSCARGGDAHLEKMLEFRNTEKSRETTFSLVFQKGLENSYFPEIFQLSRPGI